MERAWRAREQPGAGHREELWHGGGAGGLGDVGFACERKNSGATSLPWVCENSWRDCWTERSSLGITFTCRRVLCFICHLTGLKQQSMPDPRHS